MKRVILGSLLSCMLVGQVAACSRAVSCENKPQAFGAFTTGLIGGAVLVGQASANMYDVPRNFSTEINNTLFVPASSATVLFASSVFGYGLENNTCKKVAKA